jgi:hypothetical protein
MKRKIYSIIALLFLFFSAKNLSADTIPNAGFENWSTTTWFDFPTSWQTNNSHIMAPIVVRDSFPYAGNLAMKLTNLNTLIPRASCGFTLTSHPENIGGYIKNLIASNDSGYFVIHIFYNTQIVDSGYQTLFGGGINPNWSSFIIPISQNSVNADSCSIVIYGGTNYLSDVSFDDLQLDFIQGVPDQEEISFNIYPNPSNDIFIVEMNSSSLINSTIEISDMLGRGYEIESISLHSYGISEKKMLLNLSGFPAGIWIITIRKNERSHSVLLLKH